MAVNRPQDGVLGDGVASSKHPVEGPGSGLAGGEASARHLVVVVVVLLFLLLLLLLELELELEMELEMEMEMVFGGDEDGVVDFIRPSVDFDARKVRHKM
ncbi:hypothetical protein THARTR1_04889 [Trichoderma harzianum]|uniref:Uncharacterized protein n=1 Tax=Trichoderma harzianum TaxID=5544 RepID=A0A2K0UA91_TRIHA|nr:hypothetical protein THARTR1_04889 [Trichoderma harzianum]